MYYLPVIITLMVTPSVHRYNNNYVAARGKAKPIEVHGILFHFILKVMGDLCAV